MEVIKAFAPGLVCRGHKFKRNEVNVTNEANCVQNGWHAAENPLDCLSYYSWNGKNEFYICEAGGDIHEDGSDSKISCTELLIGERLTLEKFVAKAIEYMIKHPNRKTNYHVKEQGKTDGYEKFVNGAVETNTGIEITITNTIKPSAKDDQKPSMPQTGDNTNILLWFALLFVSAVGIAVKTILGKKSFS